VGRALAWNPPKAYIGIFIPTVTINSEDWGRNLGLAESLEGELSERQNGGDQEFEEAGLGLLRLSNINEKLSEEKIRRRSEGKHS